MADFYWYIQSNDLYGADTEVRGDPDDDIIQFAGENFDDPVFVSDYNDSTHVKTSGGADRSSGNIPNNNKFISQDSGAGAKSEVQVNGGATQLLDTVAEDEAALKISVEETVEVTLSNTIFYSYDGDVITDPADGVDVRAAEVGDANFTECEGSANALEIADQLTPALVHDFFIIISKSPTLLGLRPDVLRFETVIQ